jgi:hypothetical protein
MLAEPATARSADPPSEAMASGGEGADALARRIGTGKSELAGTGR